MVTAILIIMLLLTNFSYAQMTNWNTFNDPQNKFSLQYPPGWPASPRENRFSSIDVSFNNGPSGSGHISIATEDLEPISGLTLEGIAKLFLEAQTASRSGFSIFEDLTFQKYNISGLKSGSYVYTYDESKAGLDVVTVSGNTSFFFSMLCNFSSGKAPIRMPVDAINRITTLILSSAICKSFPISS